MDIRCVLVAVDGSDNSRRAVEWTAGLAGTLGAHVVAVHALGLLAHDASGNVKPESPVREDVAKEMATEWCGALTAAGVDHECTVRDGSAMSVVLDAASELHADLIVMGSRGLGGYPELLLGSTSTQVAQHSSIPVVIVPHAAATG